MVCPVLPGGREEVPGTQTVTSVGDRWVVRAEGNNPQRTQGSLVKRFTGNGPPRGPKQVDNPSGSLIPPPVRRIRSHSVRVRGRTLPSSTRPDRGVGEEDDDQGSGRVHPRDGSARRVSTETRRNPENLSSLPPWFSLVKPEPNPTSGRQVAFLHETRLGGDGTPPYPAPRVSPTRSRRTHPEESPDDPEPPPHPH